MVLQAVSDVGLSLQFESDELRADEEVATAAVRQDGLALQYVALSLRDREIPETLFEPP